MHIKQYPAIFLCFLLLSSCSENVVFVAENPTGDYVVILHGITRSNGHMEDLETYLKKQGYDIINIDYPSTDHTLEELVDLTYKNVIKRLTKDKPVHFVGHSMGGLIIRGIIHKYKPKNLGRVVQLAPPNNGSEVADLLKNNWLYKKTFGPAGQQLITNQKKIKSLFGKVDYELGVIAGNSSFDPVSSAIIPGDDDGRVSVKSTRLKGMKDHIVVTVSHPFFPKDKIVHMQTKYFLEHGVFKK